MEDCGLASAPGLVCASARGITKDIRRKEALSGATVKSSIANHDAVAAVRIGFERFTIDEALIPKSPCQKFRRTLRFVLDKGRHARVQVPQNMTVDIPQPGIIGVKFHRNAGFAWN